MGKDSAIEWTDHTFNPWWGCTKVSPACDHCYAERDAKRYAPGMTLWGAGAERRVFGEKHWNEPHRWDLAASAAHVRRRVFCASMADVFDNEAPVLERHKLWRLIRTTPNLDWLLLTKRVGNIAKMLPEDWLRNPRPNVWLGISVVNQGEALRDIPKLLAVPARVRFLSCEPLLGALDLSRWLAPQCDAGSVPHASGGGSTCPYCMGARVRGGCQPLNWVIVGGESGPQARPMNPKWVRKIATECAGTGTRFFFKQWGEWAPPEEVLEANWSKRHDYVEGEYMMRVGKKNAGRDLGGHPMQEFPEVPCSP